jgi:integral membrane sensor domain MASE1
MNSSSTSEITAAPPGERRGYLGPLLGGLLLGAMFGVPLLAQKNGWGLVVIALTPWLMVFGSRLLRRWRGRESKKPLDDEASRQQRINGRLALALAAFVLGPLVTAAVGGLVVFATNVHPADVESTIVSLTTLGLVASTIVAVALALSALWE